MSTINNSQFHPAFGNSKTVAKIAKKVLTLPKTTVTNEEITSIANNYKSGLFEKAVLWIKKHIPVKK